MYKSAVDWKAVWPSFEGHSIEKIEIALAALSKQLGIDPQKSEDQAATLYSQHVAQFLDKVLEESKKND